MIRDVESLSFMLDKFSNAAIVYREKKDALEKKIVKHVKALTPSVEK